MLKVIFPVLIAFVAVILFLLFRQPPLIRGIADDMLVSPNRPDVGFLAAPGFRLTDAARADPMIPIRHSQAHTTALVWYALYSSENQSARMAAMFAEIAEPYFWAPSPDKKPEGFIRKRDLVRDGYEGTAMTFVLAPSQDPWREPDESAPWDAPCLTRRFVFPAFFLRFAIVVEYREPLIANAEIPIEDNLPALAAFEKRADEAFTLIRATDTAPLPRPGKNLPYPPKNVERTQLAALLGEARTDSSR